jgi:hypothetical protein
MNIASRAANLVQYDDFYKIYCLIHQGMAQTERNPCRSLTQSSPHRWLFSRDQIPEARNVLARRLDCDEDDDRDNFTMKEMEVAMRLEMEDKREVLSFRSLLHNKANSDIKLSRRLVIIFLIPFFGQLTG